MEKEYYVKLDNQKKEFQVCRYTFDIFHPNGEEIIVTSRSYADVFSFKEAKHYCHRMMQIFNGKRFKNMKPVYKEKFNA